MNRKNKPFTFQKQQDGLGIITFDLPGEPVNKLSSWIIADLKEILELIYNDAEVKAIVLISGKADNFIVGADLKELGNLTTEKEAKDLVLAGQKILNEIEVLKRPVVAAIHGPALGGGLEVALACHYRVCTNDPKTVLALPEVQLGLIPAAGGTQRLPRLIGLQKALDMLLTGKNIRPKQALKMGLVDDVVFPPDLLIAASKAARGLADKSLKISRPAETSVISLITDVRTFSNPEKLINWALESNIAGRQLVYEGAKKQVLKKTEGLYPAPFKIIRATQIGLDSGIKSGMKTEAEAFGMLAMGEVSKQLRNIFFATTNLKKKDWGIIRDVTPSQVEYAGIVGGGFMGAGIATVLAQKGIQARIKDLDEQRLGQAYRYIHRVLHKGVRKGFMSPAEYERKIGAVTVTTNNSGFRSAQCIIEAVFEDIELKHRVIREMEDIVPDNCIIASNTSSIPIAELAKVSKRPGNVIGMHFFSPVEKMPLLEVIVTEKTSPQTIATCVSLGRKLGKTVIVVRDGTGFYTSRILAPYAREAAFLLMDGARIETIDKAARLLGFPVGPLALLDEIGIDVVHKVGPIMHRAFGERFAPIPALDRFIEDKRLGRKNKRGFYNYSSREKIPDDSVYSLFPEIEQTKFSIQLIQDRLLYSFLNEAAFCLQDNILFDVEDGDIGAIFGLGFPPLSGGPFRKMDFLGISAVVARMNGLADSYGLRFQPADILLEMEKKNKTFY